MSLPHTQKDQKFSAKNEQVENYLKGLKVNEN
jgi:hypothetical protein